jgi:hypothetical protein
MVWLVITGVCGAKRGLNDAMHTISPFVKFDLNFVRYLQTDS